MNQPNQFASIQKLDTAILYSLELASSISVLLLAFGLIASMANVLTKGSVLTDHLWMQQIWAWTQCIAIDASVAGTIIRTYRYHQEKDALKTWLYGILSLLLLFTAAIVSNIEAVQQTLNLTLDAAYVHVFIPVEALIWVRSVVIVLLIVAHAMRHVQSTETQKPQQQVQPIITPELVDLIRTMLTQATTTVIAEQDETRQIAAPAAQEVSPVETPEPAFQEGQETTLERVKLYLADHPNAKIREVSEALGLSMSTANKWMKRAQASN